MKKKIGVTVGAILVILFGLGVRWARNNFTVELPKYPTIADIIWLDQNWTTEQRDWFHSVAVAPDSDFWTSDKWLPATSSDKRYLNLVQLDLNVIGTDPAQAQGMSNRRIATSPSLGINGDEFGSALGQLVDNTVDHWYNTNNLRPPKQRASRGTEIARGAYGLRPPTRFAPSTASGPRHPTFITAQSRISLRCYRQ